MLSRYHMGVDWRRRTLFSIMQFNRHDIVLDAGCGDGYIASQVARLAGQVIAADIDADTIKLKQAFNTQPNLDFIASDLTQLDDAIDELIFSKIYCFHVLEHVADADAAIHNLARMLAPDGQLLILTPSVHSSHGHFPHNREALAEVLQSAGLNILTNEYVTGAKFSLLTQRIFAWGRRWSSQERTDAQEEADQFSETYSGELLGRSLPITIKVYAYSIYPLLKLVARLDRNPWVIGGQNQLLAHAVRTV